MNKLLLYFIAQFFMGIKHLQFYINEYEFYYTNWLISAVWLKTAKIIGEISHLSK